MRKNVASQVVAFQMVSSTDGSAVTSGTPTVYVTIDGGTQASGGGTATHEGNGCWSYAPTQAETNGNHVSFTMVLTGAISQTVNVYPVAYDPSDPVRLGLTALPDAAADAAGGLPISDAGGLDLDTQFANVAATLKRVNHQLTQWFIDSTASGNNDGTSRTDAWETFADFVDAASAGVQPGDVIHVNGTFTDESLNLNVDGVTCLIKAYINGNDGTESAGINIAADHVTVVGGEIANFPGPSSDGTGIKVDGDRFATIRGCRVHDCWQGILVRSGRGARVEDCFVYNNDVKGIVVANDTSTDPDPNNADVIVRRNWITGNGRIGLQLGGTNGKENGRGIEAFGNYIADNGIGCRLESAYYIDLHHNIFENNDNSSESGTFTELEIQDGESCEIRDNVFLGKTADSNFIDFTFSVNKAAYHKIYRNKILNNSSGCNSLRIAINETVGIEITDNVFVGTLTGTADRGLVLAAAVGGVVAGNVFVGFGEAVKMNAVSSVAIEAGDWTFTQNTFDGQTEEAIASSNGDATLSGNRFVNQTLGNYVVLGGVNYGSTNPITDKDATARTDAPNYRGPTTGSFIARDYRPRPVSTDQVTAHSNVAAVLSDTADMQPKLGTLSDLGSGETIADNLADMAGATFTTGTDSLEAIRNRGDAAWTTGSGGGSGSGANVVTVTVDDGSTGLQNATVSIWDGSTLLGRSTTNASGVTTLSIDDGTFTIAATKGGYTHTPEEIVVSGATPKTVSMAAVTITASDPDKTTGYTTVFSEAGAAEQNVTVYATLRKGVPDSKGVLYDQTERSATSDANGLVQFTNMFKGATYGVRRGTSANEILVTIPTSAGGTYEFPSFFGNP